MAVATVHVSAVDLQLSGSYEATGDVLHLSGPGDDKRAAGTPRDTRYDSMPMDA